MGNRNLLDDLKRISALSDDRAKHGRPSQSCYPSHEDLLGLYIPANERQTFVSRFSSVASK
jgi:hypothetical protein